MPLAAWERNGDCVAVVKSWGWEARRYVVSDGGLPSLEAIVEPSSVARWFFFL